MKQFSKKIFSFIFPILILVFPLDIALSHFLKQSSGYQGEYEIWNDIYASKINSEIVIYGSSRAWVHIDPEILYDSLNLRSYNLGIDGHNFWLQYLRHIEYLKHNKKPKKIILSVDAFSLQKRDELYNYAQFLPYMLFNRNIYNFTKSYTGFKTIDYFFPFIRYFEEPTVLKTSLKIFLKGRPNTQLRKKGFLAVEKEWNSDFENAKKKMESYEISLDFKSVALFERFIKECKENDIELILVYTPEYFEGQNFISNREEVIKIYNEFSQEFNLRFLDYSKDEISFKKSFFYNANHLNKEGSKLFSQKFAHDLKALNTKEKLVLN